LRGARNLPRLSDQPRLTIGEVRNRAIVELFMSTPAAMSSIAAMQVDHFYRVGGRAWVRLVVDGVERVEPVDRALETYLDEYLAAARIADEPTTPLFRSVRAHNITQFGMTPRHVSEVIHRYARSSKRRRLVCRAATVAGALRCREN